MYCYLLYRKDNNNVLNVQVVDIQLFALLALFGFWQKPASYSRSRHLPAVKNAIYNIIVSGFFVPLQQKVHSTMKVPLVNTLYGGDCPEIKKVDLC